MIIANRTLTAREFYECYTGIGTMLPCDTFNETKDMLSCSYSPIKIRRGIDPKDINTLNPKKPYVIVKFLSEDRKNHESLVILIQKKYLNRFGQKLIKLGINPVLNHKLDAIMNPQDNILDSITFQDLIDAVANNCKSINSVTVEEELRRLLNLETTKMKIRLIKHLSEIIERAGGES